eukprot:Gb_17602 [translate_table: standard]
MVRVTCNVIFALQLIEHAAPCNSLTVPSRDIHLTARCHLQVTFYHVIKRRSTEDFSGIPYVAALANCLVYTWYGLPVVTSDNILVSTINGAGAVLETAYICIYLAFAPPKNRVRRSIIPFIIIKADQKLFMSSEILNFSEDRTNEI